MKGFTHFVGGLAITSFFPAALAAAEAGIPWYFTLGGAAALLPDTIDFKFMRFLYRHDREITPETYNPDPAPIAEALAAAVDEAAICGKTVSVKLNTVPLSVDVWHRYDVLFDPSQRKIIVSMGPKVSASQTPVSGNTPTATAAATTKTEAYPSYLAQITVDILDGPVLAMTPQADGRVRVDFLPWHRRGSHSLLTALMLGALTALAWNPTAGAVVFAAHASHILGDQLGFMGSGLWHPFSRRRTNGLRWLHSMDPLANTIMVWTGLLLVFWNLSRSAGTGLEYPLPRLLFFAFLLPALGMRLLKPLARWLPG